MRPAGKPEVTVEEFQPHADSGASQRPAADAASVNVVVCQSSTRLSAISGRFRHARAAAVALTACLALGITCATASLARAAGESAKVPLPHSVRYQETTTTQFGKRPAHTSTSDVIVSSSRMRQTSSNGSIVSISDGQTNRSLTLNVPKKRATLRDYQGHNPPVMPQRRPCNLVEDIVTVDKASAKSLGDKTIAGRPAKGYELGGGKQRIWIDAETGLPVEICRTTKESDPPFTMTVTMSHFEWNVPVDESLFSLTPPAGYEVEHKNSDLKPSNEKQFLKALRFWAKINGGQFPETLDHASFFDSLKGFLQSKKDRKEETASLTPVLTDAMKGLAFLKSPGTSDWHYAGTNVKLDEPGRPIIWYRPKGSSAFRVIYADLSVQEVPDGAEPNISSKAVAGSLPHDLLDFDYKNPATEADLLKALRLFAGLNDGRLPADMSSKAVGAQTQTDQEPSRPDAGERGKAL